MHLYRRPDSNIAPILCGPDLVPGLLEVFAQLPDSRVRKAALEKVEALKQSRGYLGGTHPGISDPEQAHYDRVMDKLIEVMSEDVQAQGDPTKA